MVEKAKAACGLNSVDSIPPLLHNDCMKVTAEEKAACLNSVFAKQCNVQSPTSRSCSLSTNTKAGNFSFSRIDYLSVTKKLSTLNIWKACGNDGIPNDVLKECAATLAGPLTHIFNRSLQSGQFPAQWKRGEIKPLYKHKGTRSDPSCYRPVVLCRVSRRSSKVSSKINSKRIVWKYTLSQMNSSVFSHRGLRSGSSFPSWMIGIVHSTLDPRFMRVSLTWPRLLTVLTMPSWATCYQLLVWVALNSVGLRAICMNEASAPLLNSISHLLHAFYPVCPKDQFLALYSSLSTTGDYPALYLRAVPCLLTTPSCTTTAPASTTNHPAVFLVMMFLIWTRGRVNCAPPKGGAPFERIWKR